jgi:hypothetical protein
MRRRHRLLAPVLVLGGVVSATGGATVIDMPAAPRAYRSGVEVQEPSEPATEKTLGEVALDRFARQRSTPAYTSPAGPAWWGWPYGGFGYGFGAHAHRGWGWGWPPSWGWGWDWGWGWGRTRGWGIRSPHIVGHRFRHSQFGNRRRSTGWSRRGGRR